MLTDTTPDMRVVREEIFGPVVCAIAFGSEKEVVHSGNETSFGLASGIWTRELSKAHRTAHRLRVGAVWIDCYSVFDAAMPFGGYKESGWGRQVGPQRVGELPRNKVRGDPARIAAAPISYQRKAL